MCADGRGAHARAVCALARPPFPPPSLATTICDAVPETRVNGQAAAPCQPVDGQPVLRLQNTFDQCPAVSTVIFSQSRSPLSFSRHLEKHSCTTVVPCVIAAHSRGQAPTPQAPSSRVSLPSSRPISAHPNGAPAKSNAAAAAAAAAAVAAVRGTYRAWSCPVASPPVALTRPSPAQPRPCTGCRAA